MRAILISNIPTKERLEKFGIYRIVRETEKGYWIKSITDRNVYILKTECRTIKEGLKMKLSEFAIALKYLELLKFKLISNDNGFKKLEHNNKPIEYYHVNEFPYNSAFCFIFRNYSAGEVNGCNCCFCPKQPHKNYSTMGVSDGEGLKRVNCVLKSDNRHKTVPDLIQEVINIPVTLIMKYLQKIELTDVQKNLITNIWYFHIWHRVKKPRTQDNLKIYLPEYSK